jgi:PAS domain S-box-containing protein
MSSIRKRKHVKGVLRLHENEKELLEAQRLARVGTWHWDPKTDTVTWSEELYRIAGRDPQLPAPNYKEHEHLYTSESWQRLRRVVEETLRDGQPYELELEMIRSDGSTRWLVARGEAERDAAGRVVYLRGTVRDVTEHRAAVDALRESEQRFRLVANSVPVLIWMSGPDKLCNYFNDPWLEFTGRTIEAELGNGWIESVHPDDLSKCLDVYETAFDGRQPFRMQYRLRRKDGQYRWMLDTGVPRFNVDGSFAGYIGSALDVTDQKEAAAALSNVSQRLIQAQEQERKRIARELHDDVNQRLTLVAIDLQNLVKATPGSLPGLPDRVEHLFEQVTQITTDVQALSHRLHSSKLEALGLVAAMKGFCNELSAQQKVEIAFTHDRVPKSLPEAVAVCLFRILQEGLLNAVKHSGVRYCEARLESTDGELHLTIRDKGEGFDPNVIENERGIGLVSMRERVALVGGTISIASKRKSGTQIFVTVPFSRSGDAKETVEPSSQPSPPELKAKYAVD